MTSPGRPMGINPMKNWRSTLVGPSASLETAISIMDSSALRIAVVTDESGRLLGTLTDGDIRRALLRHLPLTTTVGQVMCSEPQRAQSGWGRERILALMQEHDLIQVPVVDHAGRVVGLETLHGVLERRTRDNPVFVMAGGFGTRLHPLTQQCPKPMLQVGDRPILQIILERLIEKGFHRFFFSTHFMPEVIREHFGDGGRWGVSIEYIHEAEPLGTGGALGLLPKDEIHTPLLMVNGDLLTTLDYPGLMDFHEASGGVATMCVGQYEHQIPYGVVESTGSRLVSMVEKPTQRAFINAGIYVLSPSLVRGVPPGVRVDMPTLLTRALSEGSSVSVFPIHEYWLDIGRLEDFRRAQEDVERLIHG